MADYLPNHNCVPTRSKSRDQSRIDLLGRLAKLDDNKGHVISERAVSPCSDTVEDRLSHFRKCSLCRLADQLFEAFDAEHFVTLIEDLDKPVGVKNQAVPRVQVNFVGGLRWSCIAEATEDPALRSEQAETTIRDQHCRGMACGGKGQAAAALDKMTGGHREVKTVRRDAIMHEVVKRPQQHAGSRLALELV